MNTISLEGGPLTALTPALALIMAALAALIIKERYPRLWLWVCENRNLSLAIVWMPAAVGLRDISKAVITVVVILFFTAAVAIWLLSTRTGGLGALLGNVPLLAIGISVVGTLILVAVILGNYNSAIDGGTTGGDTISGLWDGMDPKNLTPVP